MTAKEAARLRKLEIENAALREKMANNYRVYGDTLMELIELKAAMETVTELLMGRGQNGH